MLDLDALAQEVRAFREQGISLSFTNADYVKMGVGLFLVLFFSMVLAGQINKAL